MCVPAKMSTKTGDFSLSPIIMSIKPGSISTPIGPLSMNFVSQEFEGARSLKFDQDKCLVESDIPKSDSSTI